MFLFLIACTPIEKSDTAVADSVEELTQSESLSLRQSYSLERQILLEQGEAQWWVEIDSYSHQYGGAGLLIDDLDNDGWKDIVLLRRNGDHLYRNIDGVSFRKEEFPQTEGMGAAASSVDFDRDGDKDILLNTVRGDDVLLRNQNGQWTEQILSSPTHSAGSSWYDWNKDGRLDVVIAGYGDDQTEGLNEAFESNTPYPGEDNRFYQQDSHGNLVEEFPFDYGSSVSPYTFNLSWLPMNEDHFWDLFSVNDFGMLNGGHQVFWNQNGENIELATSSLGVELEMFGMGVAIADINEDQRPDISISNIGNSGILLSDGMTWYDAVASLGMTSTEERHTCWGIDWADVNLDGHLDLWIGCGPLALHEGDDFYNPPNQPDALFLWTEEGYVDIASEWGIDRRSNTRSGGFTDLNNDGCLELIRVAVDGAAEIFEGECGNGNWLNLRLDDGNSGIGAQVEVISENRHWTDWMLAGGSSFATFLPLELHFGLGLETEIEIRILWADGTEQRVEQVAVNQTLVIQKIE